MVAGPDRSAYVTVHCNVLVVVSKLAFSTPCPLLTRGGTSLDGCRLACNATLSANAETDTTDSNAKARFARRLRCNELGLVNIFCSLMNNQRVDEWSSHRPVIVEHF